MRIIWFAMVGFLLEFRTQFAWCLGTVELFVHAAVRIIPSQEKWPTQGRPFPCRSDIRVRKQKQFSRPMTGHTPRKLPSFNAISRIIAVRAVMPYTRSIMISLLPCFVKHFLEENHKVSMKFSVNTQKKYLSTVNIQMYSALISSQQFRSQPQQPMPLLGIVFRQRKDHQLLIRMVLAPLRNQIIDFSRQFILRHRITSY
jgi:hypothetical protein